MQALPYPDRTFDAVVCQFGIMFFPDKQKAYREARRVLKEGGRFIFNAWGRIKDNEFADVVTAAMTDMFPNDPPERVPATVERMQQKAKCKASPAKERVVDGIPPTT